MPRHHRDAPSCPDPPRHTGTRLPAKPLTSTAAPAEIFSRYGQGEQMMECNSIGGALRPSQGWPCWPPPHPPAPRRRRLWAALLCLCLGAGSGGQSTTQINNGIVGNTFGAEQQAPHPQMAGSTARPSSPNRQQYRSDRQSLHRHRQGRRRQRRRQYAARHRRSPNPGKGVLQQRVRQHRLSAVQLSFDGSLSNSMRQRYGPVQHGQPADCTDLSYTSGGKPGLQMAATPT